MKAKNATSPPDRSRRFPLRSAPSVNDVIQEESDHKLLKIILAYRVAVLPHMVNFFTTVTHTLRPRLGTEADQRTDSCTAQALVQQTKLLMAAGPAVACPCPLKSLLSFVFVVFAFIVVPTCVIKGFCKVNCSKTSYTVNSGGLVQSHCLRRLLFTEKESKETALTCAVQTHRLLRTPGCSCGCRCSAYGALCEWLR